MACFVVPVAEAVITTVATKAVKSKEEEAKINNTDEMVMESEKISLSKKLSWLSNLLWGGSARLLFEHIWHGEIVPFFPFFSALSNPADKAQMLHEISTVGVAMAVAVTLAWVVMVAIISKAKALKPQVNEK